MRERTNEDARVADAFHTVVREEVAKRRSRETTGIRKPLSLRSVSLAVNPRNPNLLADAKARGKMPSLGLVFRIGKALDVPGHELVFRAEQRLRKEREE